MPEDTIPSDAGGVDELLVAYLDRELSDEESDRIERRLADDAELRERISRLDRVWNALDAAPRSETDRTFANSTVAVVVQDAERTAAMPASGRGVWTRVLAGVFAAAVGFVLVRGVSTRTDRQLLIDLPTVMHASALSQAKDVAYLRLLVDEADEAISSTDPLGLAEDVEEWRKVAETAPLERKEWFDGLADDRQSELIDKAIAFRSQTPERTRGLVELEQEIGRQDDAEVLRRAALAHHALLATLPTGDRVAFLSLTPEERVAQLRSRAREWSRRAVMELSDAERQSFREAVLRLAEDETVAEIVDRLPNVARQTERRGGPGARGGDWSSAFRQRVSDRIENLREHPELLFVVAATIRGSDGAPQRIAELMESSGRRPRAGVERTPFFRALEERWPAWEESLTDALPARIQRALEADRSERRRARMITHSLRQAVAPAGPGEASRFFAEELSNGEIQTLLAMPVGEMQEELSRLMAEEAVGFPGREAFGGGRGGPPGRRPRDGPGGDDPRRRPPGPPGEGPPPRRPF